MFDFFFTGTCDFTQTPQNVTIFENKSANFTCSNNCEVPPYWRVNGVRVPDTNPDCMWSEPTTNDGIYRLIIAEANESCNNSKITCLTGESHESSEQMQSSATLQIQG